jgi:hypothetical protein
MVRFALTLLMLCIVLVLTECKKDNHKIVISGYRGTDEQGTPLPNVSADITDWQLGVMESLPIEVSAALDSIPLHIDSYRANCGGSILSPSRVAEAYPVPFTKNFTIGIYNCTSFSPCGSKYLIVDQDLHIYNSGSIAGSGVKSVSLASVNSGLYRVYYACYDSSGTIIWRGHGDILKQ